MAHLSDFIKKVEVISMKTRSFPRFIASVAALAIVFSGWNFTDSDNSQPLTAIAVSASEAYPSISASVPLKYYSDGTYTTYYSSSLSADSAGGRIDPNDFLIIKELDPYYILVEYPTPSGSRTMYASTSSIIGSICEVRSVTRGFSVYRYSSGNSTIGSTDAGDCLYIMDSWLDGRQMVIYNVGSINSPSAWKCGWVSGATIDSCTSSYYSNPSYSSLSSALYQDSSSYVSCGFDGYSSTPGRHEGIDMTCYNGAPIYSLTSGTIVRIKSGWEGISGLSTIAIYDSTHDKTVVYLHSAPSDSLYAGMTVDVGDYLGTQSWRGVSSSSAGHTHIEVVDGRSGYAKKSVNDYTLDNDDPSSFWSDWGYDIN